MSKHGRSFRWAGGLAAVCLLMASVAQCGRGRHRRGSRFRQPHCSAAGAALPGVPQSERQERRARPERCRCGAGRWRERSGDRAGQSRLTACCGPRWRQAKCLPRSRFPRRSGRCCGHGSSRRRLGRRDRSLSLYERRSGRLRLVVPAAACTTRSAAPDVAQADGDPWSRGDVDRLVLAPLRERGLHPSAEADRRTLIRRLIVRSGGLAADA